VDDRSAIDFENVKKLGAMSNHCAKRRAVNENANKIARE
jgi:hypothetical protein